jgi:AraC family transcriptional regulator of adaptative response / DNA-3-methyladenine glycosylase II
VAGAGGTIGCVPFDFDRCYATLAARDPRFDGQFIVAVRSTGIYCRPSCPARLPKPENVEFLPTAAAAQLRGYRACRRCRPDAVPGSPDWNLRADLASRAMRLISDGTVERDGVDGLAARLGYSARQLGRVLTAELGAGPLALARAHRAQSARILIETTGLRMADVAFAAGFASVRQFNDTIREVYATTPTTLRSDARRRGRLDRAGPALASGAGTLALRLPVRAPYDADGVLEFLSVRAIRGVERADRDARTYTRSLRLEHGPAVVTLSPGGSSGPAHLRALLRLTDLRDLASAVARLRRLADLDADPVAVDACLGADPDLAASVDATPGIRVPGTVDEGETVLRAVLGQQVSVAAARTAAARLAAELGKPLPPSLLGEDGIERLFPSAETVAARGAEVLRGPARRTETVLGTAAAIADGSLDLHPGREPADLRRELLGRPGLGPWTAGYVLMRVLGSTDELLVTDIALLRGATALGLTDAPAALVERARRWRPWRSYAGMHLWRAGARAGAGPRAATTGSRAITLRSA